MKKRTPNEYRKILSRKLAWARNAAKYCKVKAATVRDEAVRRIYADIAAEADAEADKIYRLDMYYLEIYWQERFGEASPQEVWDDFCHRRGKFELFTDIVNAHHDAAANA